MSAVKSGSSLRSLVLTPERVPDFLIPSRSPLLLLSPRYHRSSPDRTRLLSDHDDSSVGSPAEIPPSPAVSPRLRLRLLPPRIRAPRRAAAAEGAADTDLTTRAAMSLPHVEKVTTPYGFRAVLAASPCTRRRESLFHRHKSATVPESTDLQDPDQQGRMDSPSAQSPVAGVGRSRVSLRPVKALGQQVMKELKSLKSPLARRTETR